MPLDPGDPRAPYQQIADDLRQMIGDGSLGPGDQLPSARELMQDYEVSNTAAQGALRKLRNDGLTYSVQGRGTFVVHDGSASLKAKHPDGFPNPFRESEPTTEYSQLREELERLAQEVERVHQRLDEIDADRAPKRRKVPAKKP